MPALAKYSGTDRQMHYAAGSICRTPLKLGNLFIVGDNVGACYPPRKRARGSSSWESEATERSPSLEILPDECLFEILRRLRGVKERCLSSSVSKRWLKILTTIRQSEFYALDDEAIVDDDDGDGCRVRRLEGKKATDIRLAAIAAGRSNFNDLMKLSVIGSSLVSDFGVSAIARSFPSLRSLSFWNMPHVGDKGLSEVAKECRMLQKLDICHCPSVSSKGLIDIAKNCSNLTSLKLESCVNVGNEALQAIGRYCSNLESILIKDCPLVGDHGISSLVSSASHVLSNVNLQGLSITDFSFAVIGQYGKSISSLTLSNVKNVTERGFWMMGNARGLQNLMSLSIVSCNGVTDLSLEALGKCCIGLKQLCLRKCLFISDNGLSKFSSLSRSLEVLQLEECNSLTQLGIFEVLSVIGAKLKSLSLAKCTGIRDMASVLGFEDLSPCRSLKSLSVRNCSGFGNVGLSKFGKLCPELERVDLGGIYNITDAGLLPLIHYNRAGLVSVNLSGCFNLTDEIVFSLANLHFETLEILNLNGCRRISDSSLSAIAENCMFLRDLDVSKCGITDSGVAALSQVERRLNLQILSLSGCSKVSNKSFDSLKKLGRTLVGLNIHGCDSVTHGMVQMLRESLWKCDILS